ncbi:MAG: HAMP domain-containing sensor histidine kinase [Vicinamibacterales bacterium]
MWRFRAPWPQAGVWQHLKNSARDRRLARAVLDASLAASLLLVTVLLFWFGYRATKEWERSNLESLRRRGNEVLVLLGTALERDMRGGFTTVLLPFNVRTLQQSSRYELADRFGRAFARFPYLESFFVWRRTDPVTSTAYFFNRADQPPPWDRSGKDDDIHPVLVRNDPAVVRHVIETARREAAGGARFASFEVSVEGVPYQGFVYLLYGGPDLDEVTSLIGFTVNLRRVREHYFADFIQHLQDLVGDLSLTIEIADDRGQLVARTGPPAAGEPIGVKRFPLLFADPSLLSVLAPDRQEIVWWSARVGVAAKASMLAAERATARTLMALVVAALVTVGGLVWTVRAARAGAVLATAQSEFVSAMSHEMKTPLSLIGLVSDTLANGRYVSPATVPEYGRLLSREALHLRRLIDNVLCYASLQTAGSRHNFERLDVSELIQDSVERFRPLLADQVDVQVQVPLDAVWVHGDRVMLHHVLDNLIDNAAKHGSAGRRLTVTAAVEDSRVRIEVIDAGKGIPADELSRIFDKFYRGKGTRARGSGLGLALVKRIVSDHGGTVSVASRLGEGTTVTVLLRADASETAPASPAA